MLHTCISSLDHGSMSNLNDSLKFWDCNLKFQLHYPPESTGFIQPWVPLLLIFSASTCLTQRLSFFRHFGGWWFRRFSHFLRKILHYFVLNLKYQNISRFTFAMFPRSTWHVKIHLRLPIKRGKPSLLATDSQWWKLWPLGNLPYHTF